MPVRVTVAAVVRGPPGAREFLLVTSRSRGDWIVPRGKVEPGETDEAAAAREVREEAGVVVCSSPGRVRGLGGFQVPRKRPRAPPAAINHQGRPATTSGGVVDVHGLPLEDALPRWSSTLSSRESTTSVDSSVTSGSTFASEHAGKDKEFSREPVHSSSSSSNSNNSGGSCCTTTNNNITNNNKHNNNNGHHHHNHHNHHHNHHGGFESEPRSPLSPTSGMSQRCPSSPQGSKATREGGAKVRAGGDGDARVAVTTEPGALPPKILHGYLFHLEAQLPESEWLEAHERRRCWVPVEEAAAMPERAEMRRVLETALKVLNTEGDGTIEKIE
eukprot:TRINITY_DN390_c0_g2_i4.p2 TRINITY_DN390_c0_g2~~TRINITY_DN390_c0_g2_i4.p2  ORF type:complete len:330 (+),score=134.75 TRINITY_DN390_c0_g2_i4:620-1609(+)